LQSVLPRHVRASWPRAPHRPLPLPTSGGSHHCTAMPFVLSRFGFTLEDPSAYCFDFLLSWSRPDNSPAMLQRQQLLVELLVRPNTPAEVDSCRAYTHTSFATATRDLCLKHWQGLPPQAASDSSLAVTDTVMRASDKALPPRVLTFFRVLFASEDDMR
jgi:hypothetical protein